MKKINIIMVKENEMLNACKFLLYTREEREVGSYCGVPVIDCNYSVFKESENGTALFDYFEAEEFVFNYLIKQGAEITGTDIEWMFYNTYNNSYKLKIGKTTYTSENGTTNKNLLNRLKKTKAEDVKNLIRF